jgi:hypothetical protein
MLGRTVRWAISTPTEFCLQDHNGVGRCATRRAPGAPWLHRAPWAQMSSGLWSLQTAGLRPQRAIFPSRAGGQGRPRSHQFYRGASGLRDCYDFFGLLALEARRFAGRFERGNPSWVTSATGTNTGPSLALSRSTIRTKSGSEQAPIFCMI